MRSLNDQIDSYSVLAPIVCPIITHHSDETSNNVTVKMGRLTAVLSQVGILLVYITFHAVTGAII